MLLRHSVIPLFRSRQDLTCAYPIRSAVFLFRAPHRSDVRTFGVLVVSLCGSLCFFLRHTLVAGIPDLIRLPKFPSPRPSQGPRPPKPTSFCVFFDRPQVELWTTVSPPSSSSSTSCSPRTSPWPSSPPELANEPPNSSSIASPSPCREIEPIRATDAFWTSSSVHALKVLSRNHNEATPSQPRNLHRFFLKIFKSQHAAFCTSLERSVSIVTSNPVVSIRFQRNLAIHCCKGIVH